MPRQRMDDSFAGDFLFKESLGGGRERESGRTDESDGSLWLNKVNIFVLHKHLKTPHKI